MDRILRPLDNILNKVTMYRLMLYYLMVLFGFALIFSIFKLLPYNPATLFLSGSYIIALTYFSNQILAKLFGVKPNFESQYITGLILSLIVGPLPLLKNIVFLSILGILAMASKYLIAYKKQHIFNPAGFAVTISALFLNRGASWWAGGTVMLPTIIIGGFVMIRKLRRFHLIVSFLISYTVLLSLLSIKQTGFLGLSNLLNSAYTSSSFLFFMFIMLTEPITSPANKKMRIYFGAFIGIVYAMVSNFATIFYSLELSLLIGNLFFRLISFSEKFNLVLKEKNEVAKSIWEFVFEPTKAFSYRAGQYLEWSLPHPHSDSRGERRYFTISSSPTEKNLKLTVKIPEKPSTYKKALLSLKTGDSIYATNLEGEFTLNETEQKYVFIAGGIGVTPYLSIIKDAIDKKTKLDAVIFYIAHENSEFAHKELLSEAEKKLKVKVVYIISENPPKYWTGETGRLNEKIIKKIVNDFESRTFYISGPQPMVMSYEDLLSEIGKGKIKYKVDFFPGYDDNVSKN